MADDQKPKSMDIDELVRELSKNSTNSTTLPASQTRPPSQPQKPVSPPSTSRPMANPVPAPFVPKPPVFKSNPPPIVPPPGVKEYQSSIRTMGEDVSRLKQGQQPAGIPFPRKIEQVIPVPQPIPPKPTPLTIPPVPQFKVPSVNLGESQKTGPIIQPKDVSKPGSIPSPSVPPPSMPVKPKTEPAPQIYIPQEGQPGGNRNMLFMGIGAIAIIAGFAYWFFVLRAPAPEVVTETPTPTPSATPIQDLNSIFIGLGELSAIVPSDTNYELNVEDPSIKNGEFKQLKGQDSIDSSMFMSSIDLRNLFVKSLNFSQSLVDLFGADSKVLIFGQTEQFDSNGQLMINSGVTIVPDLIIEVKDSIIVAETLKRLELSMISDETYRFWHVQKSKQAAVGFLSNFYQGVSIRYMNFPYSDKTIDYAVVTASNGKNYLVIAGSREAMYATIDKLKGF